MARTEAQNKADSKYRKEKVRQFVVRLSQQDSDMIEWLEDKENVQGYLKSLIRKDMKNMKSYKVKTTSGTEYSVTTDSYDDFLGAVYGEEEIREEDGYYIVDDATIESLKSEFPELVK